jgi:biotin carboxylase
MTRTRVLIIGGRAGIIRKAVEAGLDVVNIQKPGSSDAETRELCAEFHELDYQDVPRVTALARDLHAEAPFARILTQTEAAQVVAAHLTDTLGLPGNGFDVARTLHDKRLLRSLLNHRGLGVVAMETGTTRADLESFVSRHGACVVKPAMGSGSLGVRKVRSADEAASTWEWIGAFGLREFMMEELLVGPEVSVETFSVAGRHRVIAITGKETGDGVVELGHLVPAPLAQHEADQVRDLVVRVLDAVALVDGPAHTEVMITADGPRIIEAHCRRAGDRITDLVELVYGVDIERLSYQLAAGTAQLPEELTARGAAAIRFLTAPAGVVTEISGSAEASALPGVVGVKVKVGVGDRVGPMQWSEDRCGHVMTYAETGEAAIRLARQAAEAVTISTVDSGADGGQDATLDGLLSGVGEVLDPFAGLGEAKKPRLLVYDVGFGPRPTWFLPRLCEEYEVHVLWAATGEAARDVPRAAAFEAWCGNTPISGEEARSELIAFASGWNPAGIATFGELGVTDVHAAALELGLPSNSALSLPALRDKYEQRRLLEQAGVRVPRFAAVHDAAELREAISSVGAPAVLKPVTGAGSMATYLVEEHTDPEELWAEASKAYADDPRTRGAGAFILEGFLVGRRWHADARYGTQVSVESLACAGEIHHLAVTDKLELVEPFREACDIMPSTLDDEQLHRIRAVAGAAISALGITNSAVHTELMLTDEGPAVIEVNSRVGGGVAELLHYSLGYDVIRAIASIAVGRPVEPADAPKQYASFLTPQAPANATPLTRVPTEAELRALPGVVEAKVNYAGGETPAWETGTRGGTLARMFAVAERAEDLADLSELLSTGGLFSYE